MEGHSQDDDTEETVTVTQSAGWHVAMDDATGIASQGESKVEALEHLADALTLHKRSVPAPTDEELAPSTAPWFSE